MPPSQAAERTAMQIIDLLQGGAGVAGPGAAQSLEKSMEQIRDLLPAALSGGVDVHAATHADGAADEVSVEGLATAGAVGTVPVSDGAGALAMTAQAGGGLERLGGDAVERSTSSTSAVDLSTIALDPQPVAGEIVRCVGKYRKSDGAAAQCGLGLSINGTVVADALASTLSPIAAMSGSDQSEEGVFAFEFPVGEADYDGGLWSLMGLWASGAQVFSKVATADAEAAIPSATIDTIEIRAISGNALVDVFVVDIQVYRYVTSG